MNDKTKDGLKLGSMISLLVGVISLIVVIPTIARIMDKTNPTLEYQVKHSLDTSLLVETDFDKTLDTSDGATKDVYTLIIEEFKLKYIFPYGEPFSLTYTSSNILYGLNLEVTTAITPIKSLAYLNGSSLRFANTGASGVAYFTINDIGLPQNYVIEIIQFV